jgi:hypothetical protein
MIPQPKIDIAQLAHRLERQALEGETAPAAPIWGQLETGVWLRVLGQARFWQPDPELGEIATRYEQHLEDLITGFHGIGLTFSLLLVGSRNAIQVYVGLDGPGADGLLRDALIGTFPGITLAEEPLLHLGREMQQVGLFNHAGRLTGVPTLKSGAGSPTESQPRAKSETAAPRPAGGSQQIERLLRALYGQSWGYLVRAIPLPDQQARQYMAQLLNEIGLAASQMKYQMQKVRQAMYSRVQNVQEGETESVSGEVVSRLSEYGVELLEKELARYKRGRSLGMWSADVHFFATEAATLARLGALLRAIFAGDESVPEPVRVFNCGPSQRPPQFFSTRLHSAEVATLAQLPRLEFPGYSVSDYARFDVDLPAAYAATAAPNTPADPLINVGKVLDGGRPTNDWFVVKRSDFAKHGLIAGVTGSGKTNTVFYLLDKLWNQGKAGVPFLVIEPAKTEYRDLLRHGELAGQLRIYTLGDERVAPLRLNPFEFEIYDANNRIPVQTHIDYLKSVFNAAFILYAPMPYVLEMCLHEIYEDKGWDLTTGQNRRLPPALRGKERDYPVFPTLTDLYLKIDEVVDGLGYDVKLEQDIKASLKTRVGSLRLGGKGLMLDVGHSVPMSDLLSRPTILELEQIGNDDEKAFVIGLILTRLYEYRRVQARLMDRLPPLQHVTVFEEAHRLLKNVPTEVPTEGANTKGQAVETFANMLSEIRAYGQGVLIAEQIPTKLTPDAIKNTNLKIMQRIVAEDDRDTMGGAMNLTEAQKRQVTALRTGQAVVYAEGADRPYLLQIIPHQAKKRDATRVKDADVRQQMTAVTGSALYDPVPDWSRYLPGESGRNSELRDAAVQLIDHPDFAERFNRFFLSLVGDPDQAARRYWPEIRHFQRQLFPKTSDEVSLAVAVMVYALYRFFQRRSAQYELTYDISENLRQSLLAVLADIARQSDGSQAKIEELTVRHRPELLKFQKIYRHWWSKKKPGPFAGCPPCKSKCLYRYEVAPLTRDQALEKNFVAAIRDAPDDDAMWQQLTDTALDAARQIVYPDLIPIWHGVALCYVAQMGSSLEFSTDNQIKLTRNAAQELQKA